MRLFSTTIFCSAVFGLLMTMCGCDESGAQTVVGNWRDTRRHKTLGTIDFKHRFVLLEILFLVAKNPGQSFDKEDLAKSIWKDEYNPLIHDKLIYTSISRLRKLIEPKGSERKYILRGKDGYTFNPRVNARFHKEESAQSKKIISNIEINTPV